jgi:outer membrane protein OmpA-like peptidoglycan-associated protein
MEVSGHTDNTGTAQGNAKLSENRARAVRALLVKSGVPSAMLTAKGFGSEKPIADNTTEEGRFRNRRIEFTATP